MNASPWRIIAEREITTRIRQKSFLWSVAAMVAGVIVLVAIGWFISEKPAEYDVAVASTDAKVIAERAGDVLAAVDTDSKLTVHEASSTGEIEDLLANEEVDAALVATDDGFEVVGQRTIDDTLGSALSAAVRSTTLERNASNADVDLNSLLAGSEAGVRLLDPDAESAGARTAFAMVIVILFYLTAVMYGLPIAQSVVAEKENRIIEILVAAVPVRALLWGKIVGHSVLAFVQVALVVVTGLICLIVTDLGGLGSVAGTTLGWFLLFYVLGFIAMAAVWAVAGSLASRQEDLQSTTMPANTILIVIYVLSIAVEGSRTLFSMVPIASSMVMPARLAEGGVPAWQLGVAVAGNVAAVAVLLTLGAYAFERTVLRTERRLKLGDVLKREA